MKLLSIIIPIYKVQGYIEKCIRSLEDQDIPLNYYEIICVNDGSPDRSRDLVLQLQQEFNNIILIDQNNQGVSCARNNGFLRAVGEYVIFIDPDDYIISNSFGRLVQKAESVNAQLVIPGYGFLNHDEIKLGERTYNHLAGNVFIGLEAYSFIRSSGAIQADLAVGILFNRGFLKKNTLQFLPEAHYLEDGEFLARVHCLAERCIFVEDTFYVNVVRSGSATHSNLFLSEKARNGLKLSASNLKKFQTQQTLSESQIGFINRPIAQFVYLTLYSAVRTRSFRKLAETIINLKLLGLDRLGRTGLTGPYLKFVNFYNLNPYLGILLFGLIHMAEKRCYSLMFRRELRGKLPEDLNKISSFA